MSEARSGTDRRSLFENYRPAPVAFERGRGVWLVDVEGREVLDALAGIATVSLGHSHPKMVAALQSQTERYLHVSNLFEIPEQAAAAAALVRAAACDAAPERQLTRVFFCNSGAEANEAAIKMARKFAWRGAEERGEVPGERHEVVVVERGFHGRTLGALAATPNPAYHVGFEPLPGGFVAVPPDDVAAAERAVGKQTCAVLVEPVQGEGGVHVLAPEYLEALQQLCRERGALFLLDEVQTAPARLGETMFAFQKRGLQPDAVVLAKGLGSGVPVGAVLARDEVARALQPGDHGSTFGGNTLASTAVRVVLEVLREEAIPERVTEAGARLRAGLEALAERGVLEVRGEGLMLAAVLDRDAAPVAARCLEEGLLANAVRPQVIRFLPPLVISDEEIDEAVARFSRALGVRESEEPA